MIVIVLHRTTLSALAYIYVNLSVVRGMHDFQAEFLHFLALFYER